VFVKFAKQMCYVHSLRSAWDCAAIRWYFQGGNWLQLVVLFRGVCDYKLLLYVFENFGGQLAGCHAWLRVRSETFWN